MPRNRRKAGRSIHAEIAELEELLNVQPEREASQSKRKRRSFGPNVELMEVDYMDDDMDWMDDDMDEMSYMDDEEDLIDDLDDLEEDDEFDEDIEAIDETEYCDYMDDDLDDDLDDDFDYMDDMEYCRMGSEMGPGAEDDISDDYLSAMQDNTGAIGDRDGEDMLSVAPTSFAERAAAAVERLDRVASYLEEAGDKNTALRVDKLSEAIERLAAEDEDEDEEEDED